ncbi:MAG: LuxR C-terminal-related transcriptional regulator [Rubrobacteraceae bacterium]
MPDARKGGDKVGHLHVVEGAGAIPGKLYIRMLGGFQVSVGPYTIERREWKLKKAAHLLKLLALEPRGRIHRERIMGLLWPYMPPEKARNNLYRTLHEARRVLKPASHRSTYLQLQDEHLILCPDTPLWTDVDAFQTAAEFARNNRKPQTYRRAIDSYHGDLLPEDYYEDWTLDPRRALRDLYLDLHIELAALHEERGEPRISIEILEQATIEEPAHEEAHAGLMRLYALSGRRGKALGQYERLKEVLARRLQTPPDAEITALYEQIKENELPPGETPSPEPPSPDTAHPHNLPPPRTSFIGREREIFDLKSLLETTRLLTLTGVGGSGKTRLSLEVARDLLDSYPDGVWFVGLSPISDPRLISQVVAGIFGVRESPGYPLAETLAEDLHDKRLLLILDNCEHVVDAATRLAETLLDGCPRLKILATSRELLGIAGEVSWTVPPLSLPGGEANSDADELREAESVRLFADRASQRLTSFTLTPENARSVAEVCRKLDGIPLAIELAAARVGTLNLHQISERLEDALRLLNSGNRTAQPRQQTLRGALDWSHELLDEEERKVLRRLSVFAGGFALEAAETVTSLNDIPQERVLDLISSLVDKSLVIFREDHHRLLEPVRQYARGKLASSGEEETVRRRHALWCLELAEAAEPELTGPDQTWWMDRLETEHDNIRAALGWALDGGDSKLGLRLAGLLWLFWHTRGHSTEGRRWLESGIKETGEGDTRLKAKALNGAGWISIFQRDYEASESFLKEGAALYREAGDAEGVGTCLSNIWFGAVLANREVEEYQWCIDEIEAIESEVTNSRTLANIACIRAIMKLKNGDLESARSAYRDARELYDEVGDVQGTVMVLFNLAFEALLRDDHVETRKRCSESLQISRRHDDKLAIMYSLWILGCSMSREGRHERAARLWGASETVQDQNDMPLAPLPTNLTGYEDLLARTRAALGKKSMETEWRRGRNMTQDQAIDYALADEPPASFANLTPREKEIAELAARGLTNSQISYRLVISERTVHNHIRNILRKLNVSSRKKLASRLRE